MHSNVMNRAARIRQLMKNLELNICSTGCTLACLLYSGWLADEPDVLA